MNSIEITVTKESDLKILTEIVEQEKATITTKWVAAFNKYVEYDYKPFCSDGFVMRNIITASDDNTLKFVEYLWETKKEQLKMLNRCFGNTREVNA